MHYSIFLVIATLILAPSIGILSFTQVTVGFHNGTYKPSLVSALGGRVLSEFKNLGMVRASVPLISIPILSTDRNVEFVEQDSQISTVPAETGSTIPKPTEEQNLTNWGISAIGAIRIHEQGYEGKGVKIAVLDTGIDYKHPDLARNYHGGYDFVNNDNDPMDDNGHGTHVAGIIAASADNRGLVGVAPQAELYAVKVSDSAGRGTFSLLVQGINWAIDNHMNVITMSITGSDGSSALAKAVQIAFEKYGIVLVAAVGNGASGGVLYPAEYSSVIGVGSINKDFTRSSFSLTGSKVEVVAPGMSITSTWPGGEYKVMSGTSMATPFVTGTVALILGSDEKLWSSTGLTDGDGKWTPVEVRNVLDHMTKHLGTAGKNDQFGYGALQLNFPDPKRSVNSNTTNSVSMFALLATVRPFSFPILDAHFFS